MLTKSILVQKLFFDKLKLLWHPNQLYNEKNREVIKSRVERLESDETAGEVLANELASHTADLDPDFQDEFLAEEPQIFVDQNHHLQEQG